MPFDGFAEKKVLTRKDRFYAAAAAFAIYGPDHMFRAPRWIEHGPEWFMKRRSTRSTVLQPIVDGLNNVGVTTKPTIGGVMESLGLTREGLHNMFCYCRHAGLSATYVAKKLRQKAQRIVD